MTTPSTLEALARQALGGDAEALDTVLRTIQGDIYGLSLRMLWNREDAEDATQEILVRIVTRLSQFDFRSGLRTWAYRVAVNYILDTKKSGIERMHMSFERLADDLSGHLDPAGPDDTEHSVLIEEVKVGCTLAMLQCLDRPHRMAYVLGEIMELSGPEAADALDISPELFRKRLQHARKAIHDFTKQHCGLASDTAPCRCNKRAGGDAASVSTQPLQFARDGASFQEMRALVRQVDEARWGAQVHRTNRLPDSSIDFARRLVDALDLSPNQGSNDH